MDKINKIKPSTALIALLILSNIFTIGLFLKSKTNSEPDEKNIAVMEENKKTVEFLKFFVERVLQSEKEVLYEDKLKIENDIKDIGNQELINKWIDFASSETSEQAQKNLKNLLDALVNNIKL